MNTQRKVFLYWCNTKTEVDRVKKEDMLNKTECSVRNNSRSTKKGAQARGFKHFLKNCTAV